MIQTKKYNSEGNKTKLFADLLMTFSMGAMILVTSLPVSDKAAKWITFGIGIIGLGGKLLTNVAEFKKKVEGPDGDSDGQN